MSLTIKEMEQKARELRELQALIDEAQAEVETLKDALKAAMGDSESVCAGEYRIIKQLSPLESTLQPLRGLCRKSQHVLPKLLKAAAL